MPPGLLGGDAPEAPRVDPFDPPLDDFSEAFSRAASDDPLMTRIEPTVLARLERRLGKPAADWTPDEQRIALRTLGFLVERAYESRLFGLYRRVETVPPAAPKKVGRPRKPVVTEGGLLSLGLLGQFGGRRRGRPTKWTIDRHVELIEIVEANKSSPDEPALRAIRRSVESWLAEMGMRQGRAGKIAATINSQYSKSMAAVAKFRENSG
jgi:hypothetical protein